MEDARVSNGIRISFQKQDKLIVSRKIYSNGHKMVRIVLDPEKMEFKLVDPVTGYVYDQGGNVTNYEVLQRKAKRALKKFLKIHFEKEKRNESQS